MTPIVDGLEQKFSQQLAVKRINAGSGDGPEIMRGYRIPGHPTIIIFDRAGQEAQRLFGAQPVETVEEALASISVAP